MSSNNNQPSEPKSAKDSLLDELQSIKGLLEDNVGEEQGIEIPILDDVVLQTSETTDNNEDYSNDTIDLERIFDDENQSSLTEVIDDSNLEPDLTTATDTTTANSDDEQDLGFDNLDFDIDIELDSQQIIDGDPLSLDDLNQAIAIPSFKLDQAIEDNSLLIANEEEPATHTNQPNDNDNKPTDSYQEEQEEMFPRSQREATPSPTQTRNSSNPFDMDLLIQEIVDEFIPSIENELRNRLSSLPEETIQQLADKYVKD